MVSLEQEVAVLIALREKQKLFTPLARLLVLLVLRSPVMKPPEIPQNRVELLGVTDLLA